MTRYKIGDVARMLGLTTQALRFYEQAGVIHPLRSENGTRYYTVDQMVLLLSFKKYRQADFSVQDIVTHFKDDDMESLSSRLALRRADLLEKSRHLVRLADAVERLERGVAYAQAHEGEILPCERPPFYLLEPPLDQLGDAASRQLAALRAYIEAMPAVFISFACDCALQESASFHLTVDAPTAQAWSLPLDDARALCSVPCARVIRRFACQPWSGDALRTLLDDVRARGYVPSATEPLLGVHIASETVGGKVYLYAAVYVPLTGSYSFEFGQIPPIF